MALRRLLLYTLWMVLLTGQYYLVPGWHIATWTAIGLSGPVAIVLGMWVNQPRRTLPWLLVAAGSLCFTASIITGLILALLGRYAFPSLADAFSLAAFMPLLLAGLLSLTRSGAAVRDRASAIDALIVTVGAGFLSWTFLISPYLLNPHLTTVEKSISVGYPLYDILVLGILARMLISVRRTAAVLLLVAAGTGLLVADVAYGLIILNGTWSPGGPADLGWIVFFGALGAAALHPSMRGLTEPRVLRRTEVGARRVVLGVASLIAPSVLLVEALRGRVRDGVVIALISALLMLLAMARLSIVATGLRLTLARERELRLACEALLSTTDADEVSEVVHGAIGRLLPPNTPHHIVLSMPGGLPPDPDGPGDRPEYGPADRTRPVSALSMRYTRTLPTGLATRLGEFQVALCYQLSVGERQVGALFVAADEIALVALQQALPVLAGQAATMLDRIHLNREINQRNTEAYFKTLVLNAADVILILGEDDRIRYASPSAPGVLGPRELVGANLLDLVEPEQRRAATDLLGSVRSGRDPADTVSLSTVAGVGQAPASAEWLVRPAGGEPIRVEVTIRDLRHDKSVSGLVLTLRDVTEPRRLEQELRRLAYVDPVTGLANRARFQERVDEITELAARAGTTAGVLLINLDDFKVVNDTMGHAAGDELLVAVADRLVAATGHTGAVARLGGDEFGVIVQSLTEPDVESLAEHVLAALVEPFPLGPGTVTVQAGIGATTTAEAADGRHLLSQADIALGEAKNGGPQQWRRYESSLHTRILERRQLRADLDRAIADEQFILQYQPIVNLATGRTRGFEALVRWIHPTRGFIPPIEFIQIAEESGLIVPLGTWVLETAVATAVGWGRLARTGRPYISVNVSARQFRTPGFVQQVQELLHRSGLPAERLTLEITESLLLHDYEEVRTELTRLRDVGVRVSIDDFGTGYSSLSYLYQVPLDILKLDKSFVDTISTSGRQYDLINGIVQLAGALRLDVVAEGIETQSDRELLLQTGCRYGQGYLFSRPMNPDDATARLLLEGSHTVATV